jgi:hypothetical protein
MSDTNGQNESRLDRIEASHVKLMTDHALFVAEQDRAGERHQIFVKEQDEHWRRYEAQRQEDRERGIALDKRIADLASGTGEFMRHKT